jgi:hypothetical protein
MSSKRLPPRPSLDHLKHQAKDLRVAHEAREPQAFRRIKELHPRFTSAADAEIAAAEITQADALLTIAREYGFPSWPKVKRHVEGLEGIDKRVADLRAAFAAGDVETRRALLKPAHDTRRFERFDPTAASISEADARLLIANEEGYAFWQKYESFLHLDPAVRDVIAAVRTGDRERLLEVLRDDPEASGPSWVPGFVPPELIPNDSVPLFCVSEASFRGTNKRGNEYDLVRDLVAAGAEADFQGGMPFIGAVSFNSLGAAAAFLDCGAAVDGVDCDGTPMAYALHFGYSAMAELLARRGAKLDLRFAAGVGKLDEVKRWFEADDSLKPGAGALVDPYAFEHKLRGESPFRCERTRANVLSQALYFACTHAKLDVAELLLAQGAAINAIVPGLDSKPTVLHRVVSGQQGGRGTLEELAAVVRFLVDHGADLVARDPDFGSTPLGWAKYTGRHEAVELLRSLGAT